MSTILRALKKLEKDKETLGARGMSHSAATADSAKRRPAGRFGISKRLLSAAVIGAAFIGVFVAAVYFYFQSRPPATKASRPTETVRKPTKQRKTAPTRPVIDRTDSVTAQSKQPSQQMKPAPQRKLSSDRRPRSTTAGARSPAKQAPPDQVDSPEGRPQGQKVQNASPPDTITAPRAGAGVASPVTSPANTAKTTGPAPAGDTKPEADSDYSTADRLTDNRLKIQAIAWSPIPDERMAVINSRIVREGSSVEGFSVVAIRSDDVIVRENGRMYRVVFGSP